MSQIRPGQKLNLILYDTQTVNFILKVLARIDVRLFLEHYKES